MLRGTLALYEWTDSEMNRRRLEAIIDVTHLEAGASNRATWCAACRLVTLDDPGFAGRGDICLFGEMLSRFLALYTDIYLFNRPDYHSATNRRALEWGKKHNRRIPG